MSVDPRALTSACLAAALLSGCIAAFESVSDNALQADAGDSEGDSETGVAEETGGASDTDETEGGNNTGPEEHDCDAASPYAGGWDIGCCQDEIVPGAWESGAIEPGVVLPDWSLIDQFGEDVRLYDFCHEAIYFEYVAMWCTSCQAHAPVVAGLFDTYDERGLMTLTYMSESASGGAPSLSDVASWAETFDHRGLVVYSETAEGVWFPFAQESLAGTYSIALPGTMFVTPGMRIAKIGVPTLQDIEAALPWN